MKERGSGLKITSNEFMESVLETRWEMIFHNALCTLLERPSRKSVLKGHSQLWDRANLDTSFLTLKKVYLNLKSKYIRFNLHIVLLDFQSFTE